MKIYSKGKKEIKNPQTILAKSEWCAYLYQCKEMRNVAFTIIKRRPERYIFFPGKMFSRKFLKNMEFFPMKVKT